MPLSTKLFKAPTSNGKNRTRHEHHRSAVASPTGLASELLRRTIAEGNLLCTSNFMLAELDRVLRYPRFRKIHGLSDSDIEDFVRSVQQVALVIDVEASKSLRVTRDREDDPVIETALRTKSNYLCSIDKDIGVKDVVEHCKAFGVDVVTDKELINILRNQDQK